MSLSLNSMLILSQVTGGSMKLTDSHRASIALSSNVTVSGGEIR